MNSLSSIFSENHNVYLKLRENFLNNSFSSPLIVHGEKGIGKSTFIKHFIVNIFDNFSNNIDEISKSKNLKLILNNSHPNFTLITKKNDEKTKKLKNYITIDQIRELESFIYKSSIANLPKIILIDNANDLNLHSSNALLKVLEEPKKNTYFFLVSNRLFSLIPTIRSRCIKFKLSKPTYNEFSKVLFFHNQNFENSEIQLLYDLTNGSPGLALELITEDIIYIFDNIVNICKEKKSHSKEIMDLSILLGNKSNENYKSFLSLFKFILINITKNNLGVSLKNKFSSKIFDKLSDLSNNLNTKTCVKTLNYLNNYEYDLFTLNLDKKIFTINLLAELDN